MGDYDELEEIKKFVSPFELEKGLVFSKIGVVQFIDRLMAENDPFSADKNIAKNWD